MDVRYEKARTEDYDEVIDLANYVFSHDHRPHDFPAMLPKLYKREYFTDNIHYAAREGGKIRAVVGAYPLELEFPGQSISGRGIGMVSVHPYSRSRGYMKELMKMALDDMRHDGVVFSCLSGRRQRYEYFGYGLAGSVWAFTCGEDNIRHTLGPQWSSGLSLRSVGPGDAALLDEIYALHQAKIARCKRRRDRLYEILSSWKAHVFAVTEGSRFEGYFISSNATSGEDREISEINLLDFSRLPEVLGLFLRQAPGMQGSLRISAGPHEGEKLAALSGFAQTYTQGPAYQFAVFDYPRFVDPFLKLRARERNLAEGSFCFRIEGGKRLRLAVERGAASITETDGTGDRNSPELSLSNLEALDFFFSPLAAQTTPAIGKSAFLQSLLPLPLFVENPDKI